MCGRARGYQKGLTLGLFGSHPSFNRTIDEDYVSRLSITHDSNPRQHIWTFAAGNSEASNSVGNCPCSVHPGLDPPSYVSNDYYCESGSVSRPDGSIYYFDDILWDGAGCTEGNDCCDDTTQPWFYRQLNYTTQDDIEARICTQSNFNATGSTLIDQLELYIQ